MKLESSPSDVHLLRYTTRRTARQVWCGFLAETVVTTRVVTDCTCFPCLRALGHEAASQRLHLGKDVL